MKETRGIVTVERRSGESPCWTELPPCFNRPEGPIKRSLHLDIPASRESPRPWFHYVDPGKTKLFPRDKGL
jgi:hypothetical protein